MPTVAITDYSFPDLEIEQAILSAAGFELRSGNDKQTSALKSIVAEADAVITQFAPINAETRSLTCPSLCFAESVPRRSRPFIPMEVCGSSV